MAGPRVVKVSRQTLLGKSSVKPETVQRHRGLTQKRSQRAAGNVLPPKRQLCSPGDCSDRRKSTYEVGGLLPNHRDMGYGHTRVLILSPTASPFITWDLFKSVSF